MSARKHPDRLGDRDVYATVRLLNVLHFAGITTLEQLRADIACGEFKRRRNVGRALEREARELVASLPSVMRTCVCGHVHECRPRP